jgi:hypothetical protein
METLRDRFTKNELPYQLIKRNAVVAMYGVGGTYTDKILHYEVCQIYINKAGDRFGQHFPESESLPSNEEFGMDGSELTRSKAYFPHDLDRAKEYLNLPIRLRLEARSQ